MVLWRIIPFKYIPKRPEWTVCPPLVCPVGGLLFPVNWSFKQKRSYHILVWRITWGTLFVEHNDMTIKHAFFLCCVYVWICTHHYVILQSLEVPFSICSFLVSLELLSYNVVLESYPISKIFGLGNTGNLGIHDILPNELLKWYEG